MVVAVETVALRYLNVTAGQVIPVNYPAFEVSDVDIYYGKAVLEAVSGTDYTVTLGGDFSTFTVTVNASLVAKLNALIAADATEVNAITVRRYLDYKTEATPAGVRHTPFTSREFDRVAMRDQQLDDALRRSLKLGETFAAPYPDLAVKETPTTLADENALVFKAGGGLGVGPSSADLRNAGSNAAIATAQAGIATAQAGVATSKAAEAAASVDEITPSDYLRKEDNLSGLASATVARANLGLAIGTHVQAQSAKLSSLAGLTLQSGDLIRAAGPNTLARISVGSESQFLQVVSGVPTWTSLDVARVGVGQTWQDVKSSRTVNTSYQNTTGNAICVAVTVGAGSANDFEVSVDNSAWTKILDIGGGTGRRGFSFAIVPDAWYYRVNGGGTPSTWTELRT